MSVVISCSTPSSIVHSMCQTLSMNERFSVVVWVDKVEVNVGVAAFCLHMGPDHIFLGKTRNKTDPTDEGRKDLGFAKESKPSPDQTLHIFQHASVHNLKIKVTKVKLTNYFPPLPSLHFVGFWNVLYELIPTFNIKDSPPCRPGTTWSSSLPLEADAEPSSEPAGKSVGKGLLWWIFCSSKEHILWGTDWLPAPPSLPNGIRPEDHRLVAHGPKRHNCSSQVPRAHSCCRVHSN